MLIFLISENAATILTLNQMHNEIFAQVHSKNFRQIIKKIIRLQEQMGFIIFILFFRFLSYFRKKLLNNSEKILTKSIKSYTKTGKIL